MKRPPARCVAFGAADPMRNDTGGFGQEGQDDEAEEITRRDDRGKGDGITEEANDDLQNDDEVLEARRQRRTRKSFEERIKELKAFKAKHGHDRVAAKQS